MAKQNCIVCGDETWGVTTYVKDNAKEKIPVCFECYNSGKLREWVKAQGAKEVSNAQ